MKLSQSLTLTQVQSLLEKSSLSEGEKESALRDYLEGQASSPTANEEKEYAKNPVAWSSLSAGVDAADIEARIKAGKLTIADAIKLMAAPAGLKIRYNPLTGTISVKAGGQWPLASWYSSQWASVLAAADSIRKYIADNQVAITKGEAIGKAAKKAA